ncbi:MAG: pyridoxine 5'-phosphate synthase [Deltaproteobacteria bacterium]
MSTPSRLSVNVNAVAFLRNRRDLPWPSVTHLASRALSAGAKGITVHPRPDERHIRRSDVDDLTALIRDQFAGKELCLEGYPAAEFMDLLVRSRPDQVLFVPDDPAQSTSDHGWRFDADTAHLAEAVAAAHDLQIAVSLFCDPDPSAPAQAARLGADRIEIYTGPYGGAYDDDEGAAAELDRVVATAEAARAAGLGVNAGHDLTIANIPVLIERAPYIREMSIGHAFTADALEHGFEASVRRFRDAMGEL